MDQVPLECVQAWLVSNAVASEWVAVLPASVAVSLAVVAGRNVSSPIVHFHTEGSDTHNLRGIQATTFQTDLHFISYDKLLVAAWFPH